MKLSDADGMNSQRNLLCSYKSRLTLLKYKPVLCFYFSSHSPRLSCLFHVDEELKFYTNRKWEYYPPAHSELVTLKM